MKKFIKKINKVLSIIVFSAIFLYAIAVFLVVSPKSSIEIDGIKVRYSGLNEAVLEKVVKDGLERLNASIISGQVSLPKRIIIAGSGWEYMLLAHEGPWATPSFGKTYKAFNTIVIAPWRAADIPITDKGAHSRTFVGVFAHEMVHASIDKRLGFIASQQLETWVIEGLADYVSKESSYPVAQGIARICSGHPENTGSYNYLTYRVNAAVQFEVEKLSLQAFLEQHGDFGEKFAASKQVVCEDQGKWVRALDASVGQEG